MKKIVCLALVAVFAVSLLAGCAQQQTDTIVGTYHLRSIEVKNRVYDRNQLDQSGYGYMADYTVVLREDGTGSMTLQGTTVEILYQDNAIRALDGSERTMIYGYENGVLTLRQGNMTVTLEK